MKALVKLRPGKDAMELRSLDRPSPGPGEVLMKVHCAGICGSDLHVFQGEFPCNTPIVPGHEFSGAIAELGPGVQGWRVGQRVVSELHVGACGHCYYCTHDMRHLCPAKTPIGWKVNGGFAEYVATPASLLLPIPDAVPTRIAAMTEPTAIAVYSIVERVGIQKDDRVVVVGLGPIALLSAIVCKHAGAAWVGIVGRSTHGTTRLDAANKLGLDAVIDSCKSDPQSIITQTTGGIGADVVVEAAGTDAGIALAIELARRNGAVVALGVASDDTVKFPWNLAMQKVLRLAFSWSSTRSSWQTALQIMIDAHADLAKIITHELPLDRWREGYESLQRREAIKCMLIPGG
jgi:L-iditol 2-dehydrogenase